MEDDAEVVLVKLADHSRRIREGARVPCEGTVLRVPPRRTETCAQIDQSIAGQLLLPEGLCLIENFLGSTECTMRLLVAKTPLRRDLSMTGEQRIFGHNDCRFTGNNQEHVKRQGRISTGRREFALLARKIEGAKRMM